MNSCCGLWEQERKTGTVHWEGRGDIEWCVCDICAHTHTHICWKSYLCISHYLLHERSALQHFTLIQPAIIFSSDTLRVHSHATPSKQRHSFSTSVTAKRKHGLALLGRLEWFLTPSSDLMIRNDELLLVRWGGCFGRVTYQLRKTLMEDSFASSVKRFQSCLWFSKVWSVFLYTITAWRTRVSSLNQTFNLMHVLKAFTLKKWLYLQFWSCWGQIENKQILNVPHLWKMHWEGQCFNNIFEIGHGYFW